MLGRQTHSLAELNDSRLDSVVSEAVQTDVGDDSLRRALLRTGIQTATWLSHALVDSDGSSSDRWLLQIPDVGPACEVLLADQLFHDLSTYEREGLSAWIRHRQDPSSGAWLDAEGNPDLSLTVLGWWACVQMGDDPRTERLVRARRVVHALGGAQRGNFAVRLWLALGGFIPWTWLPAVPAELWLLPESASLSPARISPWARAMLTPYLILARAPARLQLADASSLLLPRSKHGPVVPRLTRPGLAGDLLQAFDRTVKLTRKLPRGRLLEVALDRAEQWIGDGQQAHGGWFSTRPTILSLLALRVLGVESDDPRLRRGLDHLRRCRGTVIDAEGSVHYAQGLVAEPIAEIAGLLQCHPEDPRHRWLIRQAIDEFGPWQRRADASAGGWPLAQGARNHLDVVATCRALDALDDLPAAAAHRGAAWAAARRAAEVFFAMQEADGSFARFERGEASPPLRGLPWQDADLLAYGDRDDELHLQVSSAVLARLARIGFGSADDRVARGLQWVEQRSHGRLGELSMRCLGELATCLGRLVPTNAALRRAVDHQLRSRQRESGSFGSPSDTALALSGLLELDAPCVQARRAARWLIGVTEQDGSLTSDHALAPGFGLSPHCIDPSAGPREVRLALSKFARSGASLEETRR